MLGFSGSRDDGRSPSSIRLNNSYFFCLFVLLVYGCLFVLLVIGRYLGATGGSGVFLTNEEGVLIWVGVTVGLGTTEGLVTGVFQSATSGG